MTRISITYFDTSGAVIMCCSMLANSTAKADVDPRVSEQWPTGAWGAVAVADSVTNYSYNAQP